jgi:H+/Cl- antiporter ClcA
VPTPSSEARTYLRTLVYAALLGIPAAVAAILFQTALHDVIHFVWEVVPHWLGWDEPAAWYVVLVPGLAGVLVALVLRLPGHGGHTPLEGLGLAPFAPRDLGSILLAALASLGLGLVLGPEAPLIALGIGLGVVAARLARLGESESQLLVLAGAFAAIAALFGGPLVAAFLIFEVAAASGQIPARAMGRALLPGFVAAGTGALVFTGIGDWPGLHQAELSLPAVPAYDSVRLVDLAWCLGIAVAVAAVVVVARHLAHSVAVRSAARPEAALVVAGLLVGLLAVAFRAAADRPVDLVLFSGQAELPDVVTEGSAGVLLLLVLAKGLAYALSLGAGFRGGPVFPAIALGAALGVAAADLLPGLETTPALAAGMAAAAAAVVRVPFTAALLASLLVGASAADIAPIAVLAAAIGWLVAIALPNPEDRARESADASDTPSDDSEGRRAAPGPG